MTRVCLVLGSARCLWKDIEAFKAIGTYDAVVAVKQAGIYWPGPLEAWVTLHPYMMADFIAERARQGFPPAKIVGHAAGGSVEEVFDYMWPGAVKSAASGMAGAKYAAIDLGFRKVVLCGIPMDPGPRLDGQGKWCDDNTQKYRDGIEPVVDDVKRYVRSMSGWTAARFGRPTREWLQSEESDRPAAT